MQSCQWPCNFQKWMLSSKIQKLIDCIFQNKMLPLIIQKQTTFCRRRIQGTYQGNLEIEVKVSLSP